MVFTYDALIVPALRETLASLGVDLEEVSTEISMADTIRYFRWRHGLQHAQPVKEIFLPWPAHCSNIVKNGLRMVYDDLRTVRCHSHRLCYTYGSEKAAKFRC